MQLKSMCFSFHRTETLKTVLIPTNRKLHLHEKTRRYSIMSYKELVAATDDVKVGQLGERSN